MSVISLALKSQGCVLLLARLRKVAASLSTGTSKSHRVKVTGSIFFSALNKTPFLDGDDVRPSFLQCRARERTGCAQPP